jgi:choline dehydrogenase/4-pyridoxate dehydrogenase
METWEEGENAFRGHAGPLHVRRSRYNDPLVDAYLAAAQACGYAIIDDYNAGKQEGFSLLQCTIDRGRRVSAATAFLHPVRHRKNLKVAVHARAACIVFEGRRAVAVELLRGGTPIRVRAGREIILAAGAIHSPQLLLLSGVGPPDELAKHGIATVVELPGVGKNLQDHVAASVSYARKGTGPLVRNLRLDRIVRALIEAELFGTGFAADVPSRWTAFLKESSTALPDIQLLFRAGPLHARPYLPPFAAPPADEFSCRAVLLHPHSRGFVTLNSADPCAQPRVDFNALASSTDAATLRQGLRAVRRLGECAALRDFIEAETAPGRHRSSDDDLDGYIRETGQFADHAAGTCRMGPENDALAVVDGHLRVRGVDALRVVDASVMPDLVSGNIMACVMMIAEKAADLIKQGPNGNLPRPSA